MVAGCIVLQYRGSNLTTEKECIAIQFRTTCVTGRTAVLRHGAERWARRLGAQQVQAWALGRAWARGLALQEAGRAGAGRSGRAEHRRTREQE